MNEPTQLAYLQHARDALLSIKEYTAAGREAFFGSKMMQDAVLRNLEVVGEAVKGLAPETGEHSPEIAWRRIAGMRDQLIHHYFGVDLDVVWRVVEVEIGPLQQAVERVIAKMSSTRRRRSSFGDLIRSRHARRPAVCLQA